MKRSIFDKLNIEHTPLGAYSKFSHGFFSYPILEGPIGPHMYFNGKKILNWSLNNYLGLGNHPDVKAYEAEVTAEYGLTYPMGSRMMSGNSTDHELFENELAEFSGFPSAFLLNLGYQGIMSVIETVVNHTDAIVYDSECHSCLIDGIRLHKAKGGIYFKYVHNDMDSLEKNIRRAKKYTETTGGGVLVITEGVFGMSGQIASLDKIVDLKHQYGFQLLVDDAHGFGVMGPTGRGTGEHFGVQNDIDIYFATFTKSLASMGAFVGCRKDIVKYLKYNCRSQIFSRTLPLGFVKSCRMKLQMIDELPTFREKLWNIARSLQKGLLDAGFDLGETNSYVTPVYFKQDYSQFQIVNLVNDLRQNMNIFCSGVIYPVIPKGMVLLRLIPTAVHSQEDVDYTIQCFQKVRERLTSGAYDNPFVFEEALALNN
ncbi:glycine C-acetyltransferase [Spirosomataceae bacterium TFI 002]|nr:glycine C-acetyltransferase [Spirosomataceae bacterium TFI 002]